MNLSRRTLPPILAVLVGASPLQLMPAGCGNTIEAETTDRRVRIDPRTGIVHLFETQHHIESTEAGATGRKADFAILAVLGTSDYGLMVSLEQQMYVRDRKFWLAGDQVHYRCETLFADTAAFAKNTEFDVRSVPGSLCYKPAAYDSVVATNADLCVLDSMTVDEAKYDTAFVHSPYRYTRVFHVLLVWPLDGTDKWVRLRDRTFRDTHEFPALYREWVQRGRPLKIDKD